MVEMNDENQKNKPPVHAGKECAYIAVFTAILIAAQLCFAAIPGVEVITVLFFSYSFVFGVKRGILVGTAFSLLRMLVFGFFPSVLLTYLVYYTLAAALFGWLGRVVKRPFVALWWLTAIACVCTVAFSMIDCVITPLWYGFDGEATKGYFLGSFPVLFPQIVCTAATVALSFLPLEKAFRAVKKRL